MGRLRLIKQRPGRRAARPHKDRPRRLAARLKRLRIGRLARARAGAWAGGGLVTAGTGLAWGVAAGLITAGALLIAYCLLIADVAETGDEDGGTDTW